MIYADNAATTSLSNQAYNAMLPFLTSEYGNASSPYKCAQYVRKAVTAARHVMAMALNAKDDEIYFTSCGSESDNWALKGIVFSKGLINRPHIITTQIEHHAILNTCSFLEDIGVDVTYLPVSLTGEVDLAGIERAIRPNTILISVMFANNEIGTIQRIKEIVAIAHKHNVLMHTDAVQAIGHLPVDIAELGVDLLSGSAHKFYGPKGIGFLYIKKGIHITPLINGGAQEMNYRAGTENVAGIIGMATALAESLNCLPDDSLRLRQYTAYILKELTKAGIAYIQNGGTDRLPGHLNLSFKDKSGESIMHLMDLKHICISTGSACDSKNEQLSHVISALNIPDEYSYGTIRITLGRNNTFEEVKDIVQNLIQIVKL